MSSSAADQEDLSFDDQVTKFKQANEVIKMINEKSMQLINDLLRDDD